jgi:sodium-dependent dicarboxylate transporter 2/3/5
MPQQKNLLSTIALISGPLLAILLGLLPSPDSAHPHLMLMAGITIWIALWWLTEVIHIAVTSLIPFVILPICGISDIKVVAAQYMDPVLFLFIGGFFLAFAIEHWGLHKRIALKILSVTGRNASMLLLGVMLTAWIISMWISNTATVMMLLSAVLAVIYQIDHHIDNKTHHRKLASALMIGLAYAATIGGMATLVGTPTNMIFYRAYMDAYPTAGDLTFLSWFKIGFPVSALLFFATWLTLRSRIPKKELQGVFDVGVFKEGYKNLGKISPDEKRVGFIFILTAVLWFTRADIPLGTFTIKGWSKLFSNSSQIQDSTVAIFMAILLFIIPSKTMPGKKLLEWKETSKLPYDIILLFGSGFALAKGFEDSGLSNYLAAQLQILQGVNPIWIILMVCVLVTVISEFASNVASIQLVLPILVSLQQAMHLPPLLLMIPATLAASLGFMMPIATAGNTIVFSSGHIKTKEMAVAGFVANLTGIVLITLICYLAFA